MKPICKKCHRFYRPKKNGFFFIEGMPVGTSKALPGLLAPHLWKPYKLWVGDLWECPGCFSEIIVGAASSPISEHYKPDFNQKVLTHGATYQVNDC